MLQTVRTIVTALTFIAALTLGGTVALAQDAEGVQVKPALFENTIVPGAVYNFSVRVTNIAAVEKTFFVSAEDIKGLDNQGLPIFSTETEKTPYELSTWITLPAASITLAAHETKDVSFAVHVPQNASPGSHFGGIFLTNTPPKLHSTGSSIGMKIGSIISLSGTSAGR